MLDDYLKKGGRALFLLSPQKAEEFVAFLQPWGVKVGEDVVVDQVVRLFQGPALGLAPLVDTYDTGHEITKELKGRTIFPMTRSVSAAGDGKAGIKVVELVKTSAVELGGDRHRRDLPAPAGSTPTPTIGRVRCRSRSRSTPTSS